MASPSSPPNEKNTLQTFVTSSSPHLLASGEEIDAKNTAGPVASTEPRDSAKPQPPQPQEEE